MTNEELVSLIKRGKNPIDNMGQLYTQNKGMIYAAVKRYRYACQADYNSTPIIEMDELMHEAYFGLLKAVESFDESQGVLFMSYAPYWIRKAVKRYLDTSGQVIQVSMHKQEQVFKYNQVTSHYLKNFNRQPLIKEYAMWMQISEKAVEQLQQFMFQSKIKSLDSPLPGNNNEEITMDDTVASDTDMENEITERLSGQQLGTDLWQIVNRELKDEKATQILKMKYVDNMTSKDIALQLNDDYNHVNNVVKRYINLLRKNSEIKAIGKELGLCDCSRINTSLIEKIVAAGNENILTGQEKRYAKYMGWIK